MPIVTSLRTITRLLGCTLMVWTLLAGSPVLAEATRGQGGLARLAFMAENLTSQPISCTIATAHWYSVDLGTVQPSKTLRKDLWVSQATGEVFVLNTLQDRLPVEALWCGFVNRAWVTRSTVALQNKAGGAVHPIRLRCRDDRDRLRCVARG